MKSSAKLEVQLLVDACLRGGITHIVLSPGSRNAPLSIAFDEHPDFVTYVIPDERSAAFYALGMAQQLNQPVAIACTSGSAPLNYFPAIAEAYYQGVPLVVLTADRPLEWVDQGDGQTIVQTGVFGTHVLAHAQLNAIHTQQQQWLFERQCCETIQRANGKRKGPVHLNIPFTEPLYETTESPEKMNQWIYLAEGELRLTASEGKWLSDTWNGAKKRMVICGQMQKNPRLEKELGELAKDPSVAILVEHTSNLHDSKFIHCIDRSLNQITAEKTADFYPEVIVVIGGAIVSKRIKTFLRKAEATTIRVGNDFPFMDTYQSLAFTTAVDPAEVVLTLHKNNPSELPASRFGTQWKQLDLTSGMKHEEVLKTVPFSDLKAMEVMLDTVPENGQLHIGNSSIIRYALLFDPIKSVRYWCNRGTSGIDGSSSTACGAALMEPENWHVLISGDMSFFYDSNAFWSNHKPANLRIFVLNNGGGDIFNIIPGPDTISQKDTYFVAKHDFSAEHICKAYGVEYYTAASVETFEQQMQAFFTHEANGMPKLMEIHTDGLNNSEILSRYFEQSKA
ncbi:MAG: 2-succinyl-5-enolpyruvyl-6-hydroxy-3-cyclohexene-1-carboxylic-acid synthase [Bacteroidota bacterium]